MENNVHIDYKCTMWCKLKFPKDTDIEKIKEKLNQGMFALEVAYDSQEFDNVKWESIDEREEQLSVNENNGHPTIELYQNHKLIWDNSCESEIKR